MARNSLMVKLRTKPKFKVRHRNRCALCWRSPGYLRKFNLCRICFRLRARFGLIPGVIKASW